MHLKVLLIAITLVAGCAGTPQAAKTQKNQCDLSRLAARTDVDPRTLCAARALAKRCSTSDQCFIQCEGNGGLPLIGGGCSHVCNNQAMTEERYAREGPSLTDEAAACYSK